MDQVSYNRRHAEYQAEVKTIVQEFRKKKSQVEPGSDEEEALDGQEEVACDAARDRFLADVGTGPITKGY